MRPDLNPVSSLPLFAQVGRNAQRDQFARAVGVADYDVAEVRHGGNAQSESANERIRHAKQRQRELVVAAIRRAGPTGLTCKELAAAWRLGSNHISGRFTELKRLGVIRPAAAPGGGGLLLREGAAVMVLAAAVPAGGAR